MKKTLRRFPAMALCCVAPAMLTAATTTTWEMNSYQDFLKGHFAGTALDRDGKLRRHL